MGIHILIVDDSADYRALLKKRISNAYPDAQIEEYDPMIQERPGPSDKRPSESLVLGIRTALFIEPRRLTD